MNKTFTQKKINTSDYFKEEKKLNNITVEPSEQTINTILNYSKALSIKKVKSIDYVEMILN